LLQQELGSVSMVMVFVVLIFFMLGNTEDGLDSDGGIIAMVMIVVVLTRVTQAMREIGRIASAGFSAADITRGLQAVMGERDVRRAELAQDARVQQARRRTLYMAVFMLVMAALIFRTALLFRVHVAGTNQNTTVWPGGLLFLSALILFGISIALLLRSPFRPPVGERFFRLFWLGPIGRGFVRFSGRGAWRKGGAGRSATRSGSTTAPSRTTIPPAAPPVVAPDRIAALEQRVSDLERWRKDAR
jgi:hypothetical protein